MNCFRTTFLLTCLTLLLVAMGSAVAGRSGALIAFIVTGVMNFFTYWFRDKIVLRMYDAREISEEDQPRLVGMVCRLATQAGMPMPKVYIIPSPSPNAFATGRNTEHAAVAITEGIMRLLTEEELQGVVAHELAHVHNRDTLISTVAATIAHLFIANPLTGSRLRNLFSTHPPIEERIARLENKACKTARDFQIAL